MNQVLPLNDIATTADHPAPAGDHRPALSIVENGTPVGKLDFIGGERKQGDFDRANRHSKRVGKLKYLFPITAVVIIVLIIGALVLRNSLPQNITIGDTGIEDGKLVMSNPKLNGFDPKKRPYSVEAERAIQSVEDPTHVEMVKITAKLPMEEGLFADVVAGNGSYNATDKKLELGGGIDIVTTDGMKMKMIDAYIDLKAGTMNTHRTMTFTSDKASISAQSMEIFENGDRIVFDTNVKLIIQPVEKKR